MSSVASYCRFAFGISIFMLCSAAAGFSQSSVSANPSRIMQPIDNSVLTILKGNVHPLARAQYDRGPADASIKADRMQLLLRRSPAQEFALHQFLASLQDTNSPQYRKWLTPEQFGDRFGVSQADLQSISAWLAANGFKVNRVNKARTIVEFSGSIGQLQTAFHTQIHKFEVNGEKHLANISDPQIPAALGPVVTGVSGLNNFFPKPQHTKAIPGRYDPASGKLVPELTTGSAGEGNFLWVVAGDAATIYNTPNSLNTNFKGTTAYDGSLVTIGLVGVSNIDTYSIAEYRKLFGLSPQTPTVVTDGNTPGYNGALDEAFLDIEISGALAPGAAQIFYNAADTNLNSGLFLAIQRALDDNTVSILSVSFLECEAFLGSSGNALFYNFWQQAAAQGITVTVSAGDAGSAGCDDFNTAEQAQYGLQVSGLASTPYNIAVGGTDFDVLSADFTQYVSTKNSQNFTSALGFIPEKPWNNSTSTNGVLSSNLALKDANGYTNIVAGSGGPSSCVIPQYDTSGNLVGCSNTSENLTGWAKPAWQTGTTLNIPSDGVRDLPDVSLLAANGLYNATWLVCTDDTDQNGNTHNCWVNGQGYFYFEGFGGTSASAPAFAGILALVSQSQGGVRLGQANNVLYNLANQAYSSIFHDVTEGNNSVYCVPGSPDCGTNLFETGYDTGAAYDLASGLGSVDVTQLVANWAKARFTPTTTSFTINGSTSPITINHSDPVTIEANVTGSGGVPSGPVAIVGNANLQANTYGSNAIGTLTLGQNGSTTPQTFTYLPGGTYTLSAYYGGDVSFAPSDSSGIQITVAKDNSTLNLFATNGQSNFTPSGSYPYGTYFSLDAQPIGNTPPAAGAVVVGKPTGTVIFTDSLANTGAEAVQLNSSSTAELPLYYWPAGPHAVSASYEGDNSYNASSAGPVNFTINQAQTSTAVSSSASSTDGANLTVTTLITPTPLSFAPPPTGTVNLTLGSSSIGYGTVQAATDPATGASLGAVAVMLYSNELAIGANTITATYSGDSNYAGSSGTVSVNYAPASLSLSATAATIASTGQSGSSTVTITPTNYSGTLKLSCVIATSPAGSDITYNPICSIPPTASVTGASTNVTASFSTTAPASGALAFPEAHPWYRAGGAALACLLFCGIPARRRHRNTLLCLLALLVTSAAIGCGGGGGGGQNNSTPGTTTGTYTFTVTGTDSVTSTITANTTVTLTVN